jgi:hypothetical protein
VLRERAANERVVTLEELRPDAVAEPDRERRGVDDVDEQDGRQSPAGLGD